jgi:hypothetical protein
MPWTRRQVRYLLSSGSPLNPAQKTKMKGELHRNPSIGHMRKGFSKLSSLKKVK